MAKKKKPKPPPRHGAGPTRKRAGAVPSAAPPRPAAPVDPSLADWHPKYLSEPDIPVRRLAYWLRRDVASWSATVRRMRMPAVAQAFEPVLQQMLASRDPKEQRAGMRTYARLNELELREFAEVLQHVAKLIEHSSAEAVMVAMTTKLQGRGVTPDAVSLDYAALARLMAQREPEPGGAGGA